MLADINCRVSRVSKIDERSLVARDCMASPYNGSKKMMQVILRNDAVVRGLDPHAWEQEKILDQRTRKNCVAPKSAHPAEKSSLRSIRRILRVVEFISTKKLDLKNI